MNSTVCFDKIGFLFAVTLILMYLVYSMMQVRVQLSNNNVHQVRAQPMAQPMVRHVTPIQHISEEEGSNSLIPEYVEKVSQPSQETVSTKKSSRVESSAAPSSAGSVASSIKPILVEEEVEEGVISHGTIDPVREYDYRKLYDPLEQPARRPTRWDLPTAYFKQLIDHPTRGYPDSFRVFGILKNVDDKATDNKILRLFGRERFPRAYKYEYYTMISSGNETIKIPIKTKRKYAELYDDDEVTIDEIGCTFKVKLHDFDEPKYYPEPF